MAVPRFGYLTAGLVAFCASATLLISVTPWLSFAYRSPSGHVAIETAATVIGALAAFLVLGRFRRSGSLSDLVLVGALGLLVATNLFFSAIPSLSNEARSAFEIWAPVAGRLAGAVAFAAAALAPEIKVRDRRRALRLTAVGCGVGLLAIATVIGLLESSLSVPVDPELSPEGSTRPRLVGGAGLLTVQAVSVLLYAIAAVGFGRRAVRSHDELMGWFAAAAVVATFSRVNYFLFPSLYTEWVYTGDVLRLGFYVLIFAGTWREIAHYQRQAAAVAGMEERRRLARDLHDGLAQELAFIASQTQSLEANPPHGRLVEDLRASAERALDESRAAIDALTSAGDQPLHVALASAAEQVAGRAGARVSLDAAGDLAVAPPVREALLRIVREAVTNATRHGGARRVSLGLERADGELRVTISDDGSGFDPDTHNPAPPSFGLVSMSERAEAVGGTLTVESQPGQGTTVTVRVP